MSGILGKLAGIGSSIKAAPGVAGNMIKRAGSAVIDFVKNNAETIEKMGGAGLGTYLNLKSGGKAYPFISGVNEAIQSLPDNSFTKHLKNISKGAVYDFFEEPKESSNAITGGGTYKNKDSTLPAVNTRSNQTNALSEYRSVLPSHFVQFPAHFTQSPMYTRAVKKIYDKMSSKRKKSKKKDKKKKSKGKR